MKEENFTNPDIINSLIDKLFKSNYKLCWDMIKQNPNIKNIEESFYLNSFFPKLLIKSVIVKKIRFITFQFLTVFFGEKGFYKER